MKQERLKEGQYYHIYNRGNNRRDLFLKPIHYEHFMTLYDKYVKPVAETLAWVLMPNHFHLVVRIKEDMVYKYNLKADPDFAGTGRSGNAVPDRITIGTGRLEEKTTKGDLTASARPVNVEIPSNNVEQKLLDKSWFEDHKWETTEMKLFNGIGKPKKPVPHRHFAHLFNAYARYFNKRTDGTGNLFERPFKRKLIHNEKYLKQVILYVHNNPIHHGFCSHLLEYPWSSYITCISDKTTKLKRESVLKLFNECDGFKNQHNQKIEVEKIEKWLELDEVDYTTELNNQFNADRPRDVVRLTKEDTAVDLTACKTPVNVGSKMDEVRNNQFNADRSKDAVRLTKEDTAVDLSVPITIGRAPDNVERKNEVITKQTLKRNEKQNPV